MAEVKRLKIDSELVPGAKGEWIRTEDYEQLAAERDRYRAALDKIAYTGNPHRCTRKRKIALAALQSGEKA
jgi:hypothetical protein